MGWGFDSLCQLQWKGALRFKSDHANEQRSVTARKDGHLYAGCYECRSGEGEAQVTLKAWWAVPTSRLQPY